MPDSIKNSLIKWFTGGGVTLLALTQFANMCSDELQEWYVHFFGNKREAQASVHVMKAEEINRINLKRDSLLQELNKLDIEKEMANTSIK